MVKTRWFAVLAMIAITSSIPIAQTAPAITSVTVSSTSVTVVGTNLGSTTLVRIGVETLSGISISPDGTTVTGFLAAPLNAGSYVLELAVAGSNSSCPTTQPAAGWVCVNGGWVPPGHPGTAGAPVTTVTANVTVGSSGSGALSAILASVYAIGVQTVSAGNDVVFTRTAAMSNATLSSFTDIRLGGSGAIQSFLVTWSLSSVQSCSFAVIANGVMQQSLKFGFQGGAGIRNGQAIVAIPDNAVIQLRNQGSSACSTTEPSFFGNPAISGTTTAYLTIVRVG
jgi:hypothetical protein